MSSNRQKKFLFVGYFGAPNFGDEAVAFAAAESLRGFRKDSCITIVTGNKNNSENYLPSLDVKFKNGGYPGGLNIITQLRILIGMRRFDAIIFPGGGILQDVHSLRLLTHCAMYSCAATLFGRPTIALGIGIGPVNSSKGKKLAHCILSNAEHVIVRDPYSLEAGNAILRNPSKKIALGYDTVLSLDLDQAVAGSTSKKIGIFFRRWKEFSPAKVGNLVRLLKENGYAPVLVTCESNDKEFYREVNAVLKSKIEVIHPETLEEAQTVIRNFSAIVSMRLHPLVFGIKLGLPVVGICYDKKVNGLLEGCGLSNVALDLCACPEKIVESLKYIEAKKKKSLLDPERFSTLLNGFSRFSNDKLFESKPLLRRRVASLVTLVFLLVKRGVNRLAKTRNNSYNL